MSTSSADVIVVGCGAAGLSAAIEAADTGATVLVLESEPDTGGSTRLSAGHVAFWGTELEAGSREDFLADLTEAHAGEHDCGLVDAYLDRAPIAYRRLAELGVRFSKTVQLAHMRRPWCHEIAGAGVAGGAEIARLLEVAARDRRVEILTTTRARRLRVTEGGTVGAVLAEVDGMSTTFRANRSVVLASGGFTRNAILMRNFGGADGNRMLPVSGAGSRGDGLLMGMALGADTADMAAGVGPTGPADPVSGRGALLNYCGAVLLNRQGRRFADESSMYSDISKAALRQADATIVQVYDAAIRRNYRDTMWGRVLSGFEEIEAATLDGLLARLAEHGLQPGPAMATITAYNRDVVAGIDPHFGRVHMVGSNGRPLPIAEPPFYGLVTVPGTTQNNGGLKVDTFLRVVDVFGDPIAGLFAAGEVAGGFHGDGYLSGTHVGAAIIFGQLAGMHAAASPLS